MNLDMHCGSEWILQLVVRIARHSSSHFTQLISHSTPGCYSLMVDARPRPRPAFQCGSCQSLSSRVVVAPMLPSPVVPGLLLCSHPPQCSALIIPPLSLSKFLCFLKTHIPFSSIISQCYTLFVASLSPLAAQKPCKIHTLFFPFLFIYLSSFYIST